MAAEKPERDDNKVTKPIPNWVIVTLGYIITGLIAFGSLYIARKTSSPAIGLVLGVVAGIWILIVQAGMYFVLFVNGINKDIKSTTKASKENATPPRKEETTYQVLGRLIRSTVQREQIIMLRADQRSAKLFFFGWVFLVLSILGPIGSYLAYATIDPLPESTLQKLDGLIDQQGSLPAGIGVSVERDWRVLIGGVTIGFLLVAVGAALLRQNSKEVVTYFRVGEWVNYYERLATVVQIAEHGKSSTNDLMALVSDCLLTRPSNSDGDSRDDADDEILLKVFNAVKGTT